MGAARLGQAASDAVIVTICRSPTWANTVTVPVWLAVRRVWDQACRMCADLIAVLVGQMRTRRHTVYGMVALPAERQAAWRTARKLLNDELLKEMVHDFGALG
jgi:hypothetical protein